MDPCEKSELDSQKVWTIFRTEIPRSASGGLGMTNENLNHISFGGRTPIYDSRFTIHGSSATALVPRPCATLSTDSENVTPKVRKRDSENVTPLNGIFG